MEKDIAADGILKCICNAEALIDAAQDLFKKDRAIGSALLVTAVEEYAKVSLIGSFYAKDITEKEFIRMFRNHNTKRGISSLVSIVGTVVADDPKAAFRLRQILGKMNFGEVRDQIMYVNYANGEFSSPELDQKNFAAILRLSLRLKRVYAAIKEKEHCLEVLGAFEEDFAIEDSPSKNSEIIRRIIGLR